MFKYLRCRLKHLSNSIVETLDVAPAATRSKLYWSNQKSIISNENWDKMEKVRKKVWFLCLFLIMSNVLPSENFWQMFNFNAYLLWMQEENISSFDKFSLFSCIAAGCTRGWSPANLNRYKSHCWELQKVLFRA